MLFICRYDDAHDLVVDANDSEHAYAVLEAQGQERPTSVHEMPVGVFVAELWLADADAVVETSSTVVTEEDDEPDNPANVSQAGLVLEPLDFTAMWFAEMIAAQIAADEQEDPNG